MDREGADPATAAARLAAMRRSYERGGLSEDEIAGDWLAQLRAWMDETERAGLDEPNAMVLATADAAGRPSARTVLLKGLDERGLVFFTGHDSRKGRELAANPHATLLFAWIALQRQVVVEGSVKRVSDADGDAYWASRPRRSRLGALASPQSQVIAGRETLEHALAELEARYPADADIPRPERWGGYRVVPESVEFWQGRPDRLHDRLRFRRGDSGAWTLERLAP